MQPWKLARACAIAALFLTAVGTVTVTSRVADLRVEALLDQIETQGPELRAARERLRGAAEAQTRLRDVGAVLTLGFAVLSVVLWRRQQTREGWAPDAVEREDEEAPAPSRRIVGIVVRVLVFLALLFSAVSLLFG